MGIFPIRRSHSEMLKKKISTKLLFRIFIFFYYLARMNSTRDTAKYVVAIYNQTSNESGDKKAKSFSSALTGLAYKMLIPGEIYV
jgi:hypothetical protein